ncbi:MAG TPA: zinc ABC transporter substrate-binding protein [Geminicoccaceae bacterium]|nr:zinc ABC transporter substrate-binding protein [Geminicoccus sp.]HMU48415.1 zinc ABC transporter substrate-binding protein [Geminicoccaceae bacterium]
MRLRLALLSLTVSALAAPAWAAPKVVASIQPIHGLVAGVMAGVDEPALLVPPSVSPHGFQLRPSDAAALQAADLVVWVGEAFETFLVKPIDSMAADGRTLELMEAKGVALLDSREGGAWEAHDHGHDAGGHHDHDHDDHADEEHGHDHDEVDPHIWLSPANARAIVAAVAERLAEMDAGHAAAYEANARALTARLDGLEDELRATLAPVRDKPFIVFHDAFQYFEQAFDLSGVGSITLSPDRPPSAGRLAELRQRIVGEGALCVFGEPQTRTQLVDTLVDGTAARSGQLDAEGSAALPVGVEGFMMLMRDNAAALVGCLSKAS